MKTNQKMKRMMKGNKIPYNKISIWALAFLVMFCASCTPTSIQLVGGSVTPTLLPEFESTAQSANADSAATVAAVNSEISISNLTATANAIESNVRGTQLAYDLQRAAATQTAVHLATSDAGTQVAQATIAAGTQRAVSTQVAATETQAAANVQQSATVRALEIQKTIAAATVEMGATQTTNAIHVPALALTQSNLERDQIEIQQKLITQKWMWPLGVVFGFLVMVMITWLMYQAITQLVPALILRIRTIKQADGTVLLVLHPGDRNMVINPKRALTPAIRVMDNHAQLQAGTDPDRQERITMRDQLPDVMRALPANGARLPIPDHVYDQPLPQIEMYSAELLDNDITQEIDRKLLTKGGE